MKRIPSLGTLLECILIVSTSFLSVHVRNKLLLHYDHLGIKELPPLSELLKHVGVMWMLAPMVIGVAVIVYLDVNRKEEHKHWLASTLFFITMLFYLAVIFAALGPIHHMG